MHVVHGRVVWGIRSSTAKIHGSDLIQAPCKSELSIMGLNPGRAFSRWMARLPHHMVLCTMGPLERNCGGARILIRMWHQKSMQLGV